MSVGWKFESCLNLHWGSAPTVGSGRRVVSYCVGVLNGEGNFARWCISLIHLASVGNTDGLNSSFDDSILVVAISAAVLVRHVFLLTMILECH